jgi:hypothetical protein
MGISSPCPLVARCDALTRVLAPSPGFPQQVGRWSPAIDAVVYAVEVVALVGPGIGVGGIDAQPPGGWPLSKFGGAAGHRADQWRVFTTRSGRPRSCRPGAAVQRRPRGRRRRRRGAGRAAAPGEAGALGEFPEAGSGVVRVDRLAVFAGEYVAGVAPRRVGGVSAVAAVELPALVFPQDLDGVLVQGEASGGGFRVAFDDLVAGGGALAFDEQQPAVEVDCCPSEAAELAAA